MGVFVFTGKFESTTKHLKHTKEKTENRDGQRPNLAVVVSALCADFEPEARRYTKSGQCPRMALAAQSPRHWLQKDFRVLRVFRGFNFGQILAQRHGQRLSLHNS
jgi:hypothetical protein